MEDRNLRARNAWAVALVGVLASQTSVLAQIMPPAQTAAENAGAARSRAPGNMVSAGVSRAFDPHEAARAGIDITETSRPTSVWAQGMAEWITDSFERLNQILDLFQDLLVSRAGAPWPGSSNLPSGSSASDASGGSSSADRSETK